MLRTESFTHFDFLQLLRRVTEQILRRESEPQPKGFCKSGVDQKEAYPDQDTYLIRIRWPGIGNDYPDLDRGD